MKADAFRLDGDAALAFEVHGVEDLFVHFALRERAGHFEQTVGERGLAVVNVRDDTEVSNELGVHCSRLKKVLAYQFLDCGQDWKRPRRLSGGPAAFEEATFRKSKNRAA